MEFFIKPQDQEEFFRSRGIGKENNLRKGYVSNQRRKFEDCNVKGFLEKELVFENSIFFIRYILCREFEAIILNQIAFFPMGNSISEEPSYPLEDGPYLKILRYPKKKITFGSSTTIKSLAIFMTYACQGLEIPGIRRSRS